MAGTATTTAIVSSNIGISYYALETNPFTSTAAALPADAKQLHDILKVTGLGKGRDVKEYYPSDGNGDPKKALLNNKYDDATAECVRTDAGPFLADSTYNYFKAKSKKFKSNEAWFYLLIVKPVGDGYEGTLHQVSVGDFNYDIDPTIGQEYSTKFIRTGSELDIAVTDVSGTMNFALKA